ncbi:MAG TPA: type III pantothenate kinase [Paludibacter sp.]|nr:MAG: Type III pantothenate kinase [Bacteroidetes bacterium ADurb.Bin174]HQB27784.1 type III pantothenate kinase [Paludibacter sp.]
MNLCIDQGNTNTKIAIFDQDNIVDLSVYENPDLQVFKRIFESHPVEHTILSSVINHQDDLLSFLKHSKKFFLLDHHTPLPVINRYKTPETLGKDRLAAVVGAASIQKNADILVIDVGTAITYDFINAEGVYTGGDITPGIDLRLKSLHHFTQRLPQVEFDEQVSFMGTNTTTAIQSGVLYGIVSEIDGYINRLMQKYPKLSVFLTGGDAVYFEKRLKSSIFANKNLVLIGLNRILEYNVKNS